MLKNLKILLLLASYLLTQFAFGQNDTKIWTNKVYKKGIKSVVIHKKGNELLFPAIELNSDDKILLQFDELGTKSNNYSYSLVHCGSDWQESPLMPMEYVTGFNDVFVRDYALSQNTLVNYVNYSVEFPNNKIQFTKSGNYIIKVYERYNPDKLVLVRRFYVYSNLAKIEAKVDLMNVKVADDLNQRLSININCSDEIDNPAANVFVKIQQNQDLCKNFRKIKPSFVSGQQLRFTAINKIAFAGGNEFRHFDIKNFKFISDRIYNTEKMPDMHYVYLREDADKSNNEYKFKHDLNGQRTIKLENSNTSNIMADYCNVYFSLNAPLPLQNGNYYIYGALTDWDFKDEAKLLYNPDKNKFEGKLFLKQGYYNYRYVFKSQDGMFSTEADRYLAEGNHFQTNNEYHIFVYYESYSDNYEQLIAYDKLYSTQTADY